MNATPSPQQTAGPEDRPVLHVPLPSADPAVPPQARRAAGPTGQPVTPPSGPERTPVRAGQELPDPLEDPDPGRAADAAGAENLLRCWVRETGAARPAPGQPLRIPLPSSGLAVRVPVRYWSATGWHRFGPAVPEGAPSGTGPLDAVTLAALLGREAAAVSGRPACPAAVTALVGRVADSVQRTTVFLADRRADPGPAPGNDPFLEAEQSLLLGHPLHPTPKSREGLTGREARRSSPELRGAFPLHWIAVHRSVLASDSAWTESGRPVPAERLARRLAGGTGRLPEHMVPLPLHPWQAREVLLRPVVAALMDAGLLHDLGEHGEDWHPTSSVRTVHRPGAPAMLKLSLSLRITNSRRDNLRKELHRGVEVHRLLRSGLGRRWHATMPAAGGFDIVRDPAWLGVNDTGGHPVPGLDSVVRHNPFGPGDDAVCVAALTSPRPRPGAGDGPLTSRLADILGTLVARTGRSPEAVAAEWFLRYLHTVIRPVLRLDALAGIALEAHQQNTLVRLGAEGWPAGGWYRDNQGFYFRESHRVILERGLPGIGAVSDSFVPAEVADERFAYYLGVNNVLGLIGAFGSQGLADETLLLAAFRRFLAEEARSTDGAPVSPLPARLLDSRLLRCKANLLTRLDGLDELVGPVDGQSVYVGLPNPLTAD
ncbi:IucA/IucC family protein [Streptomyces sp. ACA25]|uniref:IucA/IucC family protein n=1 Tax=Streptomyces sp. ACA25 TaxID=3022596 RepID=UPI00230829FE|nr:IucA/IucC family protein [Streptomyces sp. ACA25]MDB1088836.1 IucA/IucC family protein [Streptomyces sp. ACA25]